MIRSITLLVYIVVLVSILISFTGCTCEPQIKYVDKPYEVKVPVKCIVPDTNCSFNRPTDTEVISSLLECIIDMKHNQEVCK
jgi:hypothetical protein